MWTVLQTRRVKVVCLVVSHSYRLFRLNSESGKVSELVWLLWAELYVEKAPSSDRSVLYKYSLLFKIGLFNVAYVLLHLN